MTTENDQVKLLRNPKKIQSAAVNLAVATYGAQHDVIVRCDAHALYPPGFLNSLLSALARTGADSVVIPMDSVGQTCVQRAIAWVSDSAVGSGGAAHRAGKKSGFVDHGHHAAIRTEAFRRIGGYDETYAFNEDAELDSRLARYGGSIYLDSEIRMKYMPRDSLAKLMRQYFYYGLGRSRTMRRHPGSARIRQMVVPLNFLSLLASFAMQPFSRVFLTWPIAYFFVLALVSLHIAFIKRSMCGLLAGLAAFIMHNAWAAGFIYGVCSMREKRWEKPEIVQQPMG
jgi:succinoglycan biosynthesis protein ExoA